MEIAREQIKHAQAALSGTLDSLQIITADALAQQYYPALDPGQPVLVTGLAGPGNADRVRTLLSAAYPADWIVTVVDE